MKDGVMLSCRVPREDVECLDSLAREAGCSRSEYIRRILKLPVAMQIETASSLRTASAARDGGTGGEVIPHGAVVSDDCSSSYTLGESGSCGDGRRSVLVLTDVPIRRLCVAIDRWGTNYNQAVRALNALVKRLQGVREIDGDDAREIFYLLQACARGNENAKAGIDSVAQEARNLLGIASIDLRQRRPARRVEAGSIKPESSEAEGSGES